MTFQDLLARGSFSLMAFKAPFMETGGQAVIHNQIVYGGEAEGQEPALAQDKGLSLG